MKTTLRNLFWACFFMFSMTQCSLCTGPCTKSPLPPEAKQYFDFDEGSYWIYRNTQNGAIDSFSVYSRQRGAATPVYKEDGEGCIDEMINLTIKSLDIKDGLSQNISSNTRNNSNNRLWLGFFVSPQIDYKTVIDTTIANNLYQQVLVLNNCCLLNNCNVDNLCDSKYKPSFTFTKLMYAPNVGLIRWEMDNHPLYGKVVYELIRYKIVKPPKI